MPEQTIESAGKKYTFDYEIDRNIEKIGFTIKTDLEGFEKGTPYADNKTKTLKAVYLKEGNESNWYLLQEGNIVTEKVILIEIDDVLYGFIGIPEQHRKQPQMTLAKIDFNKIEIEGFVYEESGQKDYLMLYLIDESGEPDFFLYHQSDAKMLKIGEYRLLDPKKVDDKEEMELEEENPQPMVADSRSILFLILSLLAIAAMVVGVLFYRHRRN